MEINSEKMSTEMENGVYEQPSLKKYGTMKELTLATAGSGGDGVGSNPFNTEVDEIGNESGEGSDPLSPL